jgi:hypothetical protein
MVISDYSKHTRNGEILLKKRGGEKKTLQTKSRPFSTLASKIIRE